ncbi:restriction endonuclease subunit S [Acinetobacter pittii]|uniref:restriction endonuclease subunit S n=1 Tax=Acinetobacter pittii TaxID=48296 RepID=UPI00083FA9C9|nr:restriction endonuclease subunit S [Acinetobacter pittii]MCE5999868.1 restriction endonuclease subunit S [Acinetobacter pittii]ODL93114.1 restriction endonuclease subunit S [Acinetobacter pittii]SSV83353.1 specificity determinant for hsdM and hsdR [Acinetobacter pittii]
MKSVRFGDLCKLQNGRAFKPEEWSEEGTPIVRIQNLNDETKPFNYCNFDVEKRFWIDSGDLLFSWSGTPGTSFGAFFWNRGKGFLNQHIFRVDIKEELVDKHYLSYALNSLIIKIIDQAHGGVGLKHITKAKLEEVQIPLPPLAEQRRIASILDQADELRQKRSQAIEKLDQLLQATFIDMFGDPVSNPKGWEKKKIKQVLTKLTDGTHHSPPAMDEGIPYITAKHIKEGFIDFYSKPTFVSIEDHKAIYSRCDPKQGDVLYIKDGATTGIASINYFNFEFSLLSSVALLRPDSNLITNDYLESWLNHKTVKQNILQNMGGAAIKRLTLAKIKNLDILVPNLENQNIFSKVKRQIYNQRQILERSLSIHDDLFQSLQNQAFNGTL